MFRRILGQQRTPRLQARGSLGRQMALILLPLVLIPLLVMAAVAYNRARTILQEQVQGQMSSTTETQIELLDEWKTAREQQLFLASQRPELRDGVSQLLRLQEGGNTLTATREAARAQLADLRTLAGQTLFSDALVVRASDGLVVAAVNQDWESHNLPALTLAGFPAGSALTLPVYNDPFFAPDRLAILTSVPMRLTASAAPNAFLVGVNTGLRLGQLMEQLQVFVEQRGVFRIERGQTYLMMRPDILIRLPRYSTEPESLTGIRHPVFNTQEAGQAMSLEYSNLDGTPVLGNFEWIPGWQVSVVNEVPQAQIYAGLSSLAPFTAAILAGSALFTLIVVVFATNRLLRPLGTLTEFAGRVSQGDWEYRVPEDRNDELGMLANALNRMAEDLSGVYRSLEARVEERTRQIRTASEVARAVTSTPNLDDLMRRAVDLIRDRFGYYHVSIFLLDEGGKEAVLRESTGEVGAALKARGHNLAVGSQSVIGFVTANNQPRVASDVGHDPIHFKNELLPGTRSEAAVPLQVGGRVLGALDVQSLESNAFNPEDVLLLQTLADQLSAAIQNARLAQTSALAADRARLISEATTRMTGLLDMERVLETAAQVLHKALGQPGILIQLVAPEDGAQPESIEVTERDGR
jgi:HAMP domain-containing protein